MLSHIRRTIAALVLVTPTLPAQEPVLCQVACVRAPCPPQPCGERTVRPLRAVERSARDVTITLEGRVLRYEVTEKWTNHGGAIGEADYVLPLPRGAAFEDLALEIDGEMVTGETMRAGEARRIYEEIVRRQRDPALVEWMDLGVLRTRIFPIQPGETRTVTVRFRAVAEREGDALRVDVPAPRGAGTTSSGTTITMRWPTGEGYGDVWSPSHRVTSDERARGREVRVHDANGTVTLLVPVRNARGATVSVLTHAPSEGEGYALITLAPPTRNTATTARDVTFVLDVSGSMAGRKMEQARAAGRQLLASLGRTDRVRLIAFANDVSEFRDGWSAMTPETRAAAEEWLDALAASGGTNIGGALDRALEEPVGAGRLGMVLFLTDGEPTVGERSGPRLAARAGERRGGRRVFSFGIGANVNVPLLEQLALDGAGTAHFVRPEEDVERVVSVVAQRITQPVATDIRIRAEGVTLHAVQPAGTIDLFAGQELTILARYRGHANDARVVITGRTPQGPVTWEAEARFPERRSTDAFVGRLWASQRVGWLSAERRRNGPSAELDDEIRTLGERWGIPTALTSYLVLEPGMTADASGRLAMPAPRNAMRSERPMDSPNSIAMAPAAAATSGAGAASSTFEQAKAAAEMRAARSVGDLDAASGPRAEREAAARRTATRSFVLRDSTWVDQRRAAPNARRVAIQPYSAAYFAVMERIPELREAFALGDRVEVHGAKVTLVLAADGERTLSPVALTQLTRDW